MANFDVYDLGEIVLNPGAEVWRQCTWGFAPSTFIWVTAQPVSPHMSVEAKNHDNWMDENGTIHHNYSLVNGDPNNACLCHRVIFKAWP